MAAELGNKAQATAESRNVGAGKLELPPVPSNAKPGRRSARVAEGFDLQSDARLLRPQACIRRAATM